MKELEKMGIEDVTSRINNIEECQNMLKQLSEHEKEPYFKNMFRCSSDMLGEYKTLLVEMTQ